MSARAARAAVRGACPGVLRPMESGDGLLVRVKPRAATLSLAEVQSIAEAARRFGNGHIDLTRRANVQLRGVTAAALPALTAHLADAGLLDAAPEIEAVRNVVVSPLAGLDPSEVIDVGPLAHAFDRLLATDARLWRLPPKFGFLIDGGGLLSLDGERADLRLKALRAEGRVVMALAIDGDRGPRRLGTVSLDDAVEALHRCALAFLAGQAQGSRARLRDGAPAVERRNPRRAFAGDPILR